MQKLVSSLSPWVKKPWKPWNHCSFVTIPGYVLEARLHPDPPGLPVDPPIPVPCLLVILTNFYYSMNCVVIVEKIRDTRAPFYRPQLPQQESEGVHPDILTLMKQCWAEEPSERPSFVEVAKVFRIINKGRSVFFHLCNISINININIIKICNAHSANE